MKNIKRQLSTLTYQASGALSSRAAQLTASADQIKWAVGQLSTNPITAVKDLSSAIGGLKGKSSRSLLS